jgi:SAM-dependent methyltransferase
VSSESFNNKTLWENEWNGSFVDDGLVPGHLSSKPSPSIVKLIDFVRENDLTNLDTTRCLDIGCGLGRNALYLAGVCDEVTGIDYVQSAIDSCKKQADTLGINNVNFVRQDMLNYEYTSDKNTYNLVIDSLTSTSIAGRANRTVFANNVYNLMHRNGFLLVRAVSTEDEFEQELMMANPGPEDNSSIWPISGKFQKNFTEEELVDMYKDLEPVTIEYERKEAIKMGREFLATNLWALFKKA